MPLDQTQSNFIYIGGGFRGWNPVGLKRGSVGWRGRGSRGGGFMASKRAAEVPKRNASRQVLIVDASLRAPPSIDIRRKKK